MRTQQQGLGRLSRTAVAAAAALLCASAQAQTNVYLFGTQISGNTYQPTTDFAALSVSTTDSMHYVFDLLVLGNFNTLFGSPTATIFGLVFNTANNVDPIASSVRLASGSWGVDRVFYSSPNAVVGGINFDFMEGWGWGNTSGSPQSLLTANERVVWQTDFAVPTTFTTPPFALKVYGFGANGTSHAWYVPTSPVPEPETYGMLLAGLGMLGFAARRRKAKEAFA